MLELLTVAAFVGYIIYLRNYADQRSTAEKQADQLREGITLYQNDQFAAALAYFNQALESQPKLGVAYLYRARIYRTLGDMKAALKNLETGKSYDDTIADLHLETGQVHYQLGDYVTAFQDFDKAIFHGASAEAYYWRGLTRQQTGEPAEAAQDLARAESITSVAQLSMDAAVPVQTEFVSRSLVVNAGFTVINALLLLFVIKYSPVIHWPYLLAAFSAGAIGFAEPRKGWALAIGQALLIWTGYTFVVGPAASSVDREVESFSLYGAIGLTFVGSFLGSILKRAQAGA
ncbi:tetratricopeptide repeat protein [Fibrella forsythiae]|uniref:Tetratricopeptide repeat protein n=1 Tax=Fibrella forsythiae TaxID=2817061 RepID=A0ABS3JGI8_9BACT|nr:tetratricopeptide repeat protein [Fibrella forsythiae]MBO0949119.1 tetratricopeptide repeat protein [Fibrella forsythiae]